MTAMGNSRRRFLAFLGLAGLPAAVWSKASAQTGEAGSSAAPNPSVNCEARVTNSAAAVEYFRNFSVVNGTLTDDDIGSGTSSGTINLKEGALSHQFAEGYDAAGLIRPDATDFDESGPTFAIDGAEYPTLITCHFMVALKVPKMPAAVTLAAVFSDSEAYGTSATCTPGSDGASLVVSGMWGSLPEKTLTTTFYVVVMADNVNVAQFGYNFNDLNWQDFLAQADKTFAGKTGVTVDAGGGTNVPGCSVATAGGACFFTTAASHTLGLSDDCWELRTLRAFRDGPLAGTPDGRALTGRYYAEAPRLVAGIGRRADAARVWLGAYFSHILPCAVLARLGLYRLTIRHYSALFARLDRLA